jgi:hypothetical protein
MIPFAALLWSPLACNMQRNTMEHATPCSTPCSTAMQQTIEIVVH